MSKHPAGQSWRGALGGEMPGGRAKVQDGTARLLFLKRDVYFLRKL